MREDERIHDRCIPGGMPVTPLAPSDDGDTGGEWEARGDLGDL